MKPIFKITLILSFLITNFLFLIAQVTVDSNFAFQLDPAKKYSLYIPSGYVQGTPNKMMLALHPFNTSRWDGESWRDTLIVFAETNNLLLVSPDGGADGKIDDPIDTAFTTALMDSVMNWYTIDDTRIFAMGFSWGSKAVYTYGLRRPWKFAGYMPVGAAVNGVSDVTPELQGKSNGKPVYIVHGSQDSPNTRYWPVLNALTDSGACVNSILMSGVGHTIDFPNRNQILTDAFVWLDSVNCSPLVGRIPEKPGEESITVFPNPSAHDQSIKVIVNQGIGSIFSWELISSNGNVVGNGEEKITGTGNGFSINTASIASGIYFLKIRSGDQAVSKKVVLK